MAIKTSMDMGSNQYVEQFNTGLFDTLARLKFACIFTFTLSTVERNFWWLVLWVLADNRSSSYAAFLNFFAYRFLYYAFVIYTQLSDTGAKIHHFCMCFFVQGVAVPD